MRFLISLLLVLGIGLGAYFYFLKSATPAGGATPMQTISTTGVQMDLIAIAQAERAYFAQNGSYTTVDQLQSSGSLNMTATGRDGYTYSVDTSTSGFSITASHADVPTPAGADTADLHYPTISIDQTMQIHQSN